MIPAVVVLKDRPLTRGHRLYATAGPGRRGRGDTCAVDCSCGDRLVVATVDQYQDALDLAARNHRHHLDDPDLGLDPAPGARQLRLDV